MPKKRKMVLLVLVSLLLLSTVLLAGCGGTAQTSNTANKPTIVVGSKTFTEAQLLGTMTYQYLKYLGYPVQNKVGLGELAVIRPALLSGQVSAYWEYTGTVLINVMNKPPSFNEQDAYQQVKDWDAKNGIVWLPYAPLDDTYGIMVRPDIAAKYHLKTISDLVAAIKGGANLKFASTQEWVNRPDGLQYWEKVYNFQYPPKDLVNMALNIGYEALKDNQVDVGLAYTTDARVKAYNLVLLQDDKQAFPVYNAAPLFRKDILDAYPQIPAQMLKLSQLLDNTTITELNKQVDVDKKSVDQVSQDFLTQKGLIK